MLHEVDDAFAHLAAQIECKRERCCCAQHAQRHGALGRIRHLQVKKAAVSFGRGLDQSLHLLAHPREREAVVGKNEDRAHQLRSAACPVLKQLLGEVIERHDELPLVPDRQHHEGAGDLFEQPHSP